MYIHYACLWLSQINLTVANDLIHCRIYTPMESLSSGVCSLSSWSSLSLPLLLSLSDPVTGKTIINEGSTSYYPLNVLLKISVFILQFEYLFKLFVFSSRRICFKFFFIYFDFSNNNWFSFCPCFVQCFSVYLSLTQNRHCWMPHCPGDHGALGLDSPEILLPLHARVPGMRELGIFLLHK